MCLTNTERILTSPLDYLIMCLTNTDRSLILDYLIMCLTNIDRILTLDYLIMCLTNTDRILKRQSEGQLYPPLQNDNGAASKFKAQTGGLQL